MDNPKPPGIYETFYGNAAEVESWDDLYAYDLDMDKEIPISAVTGGLIMTLEERG